MDGFASVSQAWSWLSAWVNGTLDDHRWNVHQIYGGF